MNTLKIYLGKKKNKNLFSDLQVYFFLIKTHPYRIINV